MTHTVSIDIAAPVQLYDTFLPEEPVQELDTRGLVIPSTGIAV